MFEIQRSFRVFILAKCYGSFNKFNTYFLWSLDSSLFFFKLICYMVLRPGNINSLKNSLSGKMGDEELKKKRKIRGGHKGLVVMTLEKVKALLHEFGPPLVNQLNTCQIALTEKLNVLGAQDDKILALMTEEHIKDEIKETGNFRESIHQMIVEIDKTLNAVELEKARNIDKPIPLSNSNLFTKSLNLEGKTAKD